MLTLLSVSLSVSLSALSGPAAGLAATVVAAFLAGAAPPGSATGADGSARSTDTMKANEAAPVAATGSASGEMDVPLRLSKLKKEGRSSWTAVLGAGPWKNR